MISAIATCTARIVEVTGTARSGKTEALVRRCSHLLAEGAHPEDILVETSSAFAAQAFRTRLERIAGPIARNVRIASAQDICRDVLDTDAARSTTGRTPRLLIDAEYKFLLEDMKTLGQPVRRLRTMLGFFYAQWAECIPEEEWLLAGEETDVLRNLRRLLVSRDAMLTEETAFLAACYLESDAGVAGRHAYRTVLCDDFQNMSRAEQTALCMLAADQLVVAGNPNQTVAVRNSHPHPQGLVDFHELRRDVQVFELEGSFGNPEITSFAEALTRHGDMDARFAFNPDQESTSTVGATGDARESDVLAVKWHTPEDELNGITKYLRMLIDRDEDAQEENVFVLVPNRTWARAAERVLRQRGFAVNVAGLHRGIGGDPRDNDRSKAMQAYTRLNLLADPLDITAWRSWCGFGNYLTNSDAWMHLHEYAESSGCTLYEALTQAAASLEPAFLRAEALTQPFEAGQAFIADNQGRKGFALLRAIGAEGLPEFESIAQEMCGDEDAETVLAMERRAVLDPVFPEHLAAVRIVTAPNLCGLEASTMIVLGAVDGFYPCRNAFEVISTDEERERTLNEDRRAFYTAISKACDLLAVSTFAKADLELAESTKMQVGRVRSEHGDRIALARASRFLSEAGNACPSTIGGQQLLSSYGLA